MERSIKIMQHQSGNCRICAIAINLSQAKTQTFAHLEFSMMVVL